MIEPPNEVRNFVHRRIIAAGKAFLTGGPVGAAGAFVAAGGAGSVAPDRLCDAVGRPTAAGIAVGVNCSPAAAVPRTTPRTSATSACIWPLRQDPVTGQCKVFVGEQPGAEPGGVGGGQAIMGRYGAAMVPDVEQRQTLDCLPGMVLGKDNLCYNKGDLSNKERKYPRGTRPLGTPGEMAALRKAASFGRRMETTIKRMQKIGVVKKPAPRKAAPRSRQITSGSDSVRVVNVD